MQLTCDNPLVRREIRARMRGHSAFIVQLVYLLALAGAVVVASVQAAQRDVPAALDAAGIPLLQTLGVVLGALVALIAPALAAGAISLEREQQTLDGLFVSPLSTAALFRGKLLAATLFMAHLLTIGLPIMGLSMLLGGVGIADLVGCYAVLVANALFLAAVGLGWSLLCNRTAQATVATYLCVVGWVWGTFVLTIEGGPRPLSAVCPLLPTQHVGLSAEVGGWPVPVWLTSALAVLALAAWVLDASACRARLLRDGRASWRPRLWLALAYATAVGAASGLTDHTPQLAALWTALFGAVVVAAVTIPVDPVEHEARPVAWWEFWRHATPSAPLFALLLPVLPTLLALAHRPLSAVAAVVVITSSVLVAVLALKLVSRVVGLRWPSLLVGVGGLAAAHLVPVMACSEFMSLAPGGALANAAPYGALVRIACWDSPQAEFLLPARVAIAANLALAGLLLILWRERTRRSTA